MLKIIGMQEGEPSAMLEMGRFYMRFGKLEKADEYLRDAYSFQIKNNDYALIYACFLMQIGRTKEACVILNKLAVDRYNDVVVNMLISLAYDMDSDTVMAQKYKAKAHLTRLRELGKVS